MKKLKLDEIFQAMDELGIAGNRPAIKKSPEESKILEEFAEINRFIDEKGFIPGENLEKRSMNLSERRLKKRLSVYRQTAEYTALLRSVDKHHILSSTLDKTEILDESASNTSREITSSFQMNEMIASAENQSSVPASLDDIFNEDSPLLSMSPEVAAMFTDSIPWEDKQASRPKRPDKVARRIQCQEFGRFKPLFDQCVQDLISGKRISMRFRDEQNIKKGDFFILKGIMVYVADYGKIIVKNGKTNARLRLIFNNGMEGENLLRSLARELYKDPNGRRISGIDGEDVFNTESAPSNISNPANPSANPIVLKNMPSSYAGLSHTPPRALNTYLIPPKNVDIPSLDKASSTIASLQTETNITNINSQQQKTGSIYILRSLSQQPDIVSLRKNLFKIGFTTGDINRRLQNAEEQPTYLLAKVEIVRVYQCSNLNVSRFETLLHRFFRKAQADIDIKDRFGKICYPKEWFILPLNVIDQAIQLLITGKITEYIYDVEIQRIIRK